MRVAEDLRAFAAERGSSAAAMAIAFALLNERVASVLFGATSPEQLTENAGAVKQFAALDDHAIAELRGLARTST